jgi:hypothetical protein
MKRSDKRIRVIDIEQAVDNRLSALLAFVLLAHKHVCFFLILRICGGSV